MVIESLCVLLECLRRMCRELPHSGSQVLRPLRNDCFLFRGDRPGRRLLASALDRRGRSRRIRGAGVGVKVDVGSSDGVGVGRGSGVE